ERGLAGAGRGGHHHRAGGRGGLERATGGADGQPRPDGGEVEAVRRGRCGGHRSIMPRRAPVRVLATAVNGWPADGRRVVGRRSVDEVELDLLVVLADARDGDRPQIDGRRLAEGEAL